ncbi:MAG: hypothetical protein WAV90_15840 [Gordonia amarae]
MNEPTPAVDLYGALHTLYSDLGMLSEAFALLIGRVSDIDARLSEMEASR